MEAVDVEMPCVVLACWVDPVELVEAMDACELPDLSLLALVLEVPRQVDEVNCLESWVWVLVAGIELEVAHPMDSLAWVVVEAALVLYQSLEAHLVNRSLLVCLYLLLEGLS